MDVLHCWGSCSETSRSGKCFQLLLIKQRLATQVLRSISSEIFELCLWLAAPNSNHLTAGDVSQCVPSSQDAPIPTQPGKHSLQQGHQTSMPASSTTSHPLCSPTSVPHIHLCHALLSYPGYNRAL